MNAYRCEHFKFTLQQSAEKLAITLSNYLYFAASELNVHG